jgi:hypothetical protein
METAFRRDVSSCNMIMVYNKNMDELLVCKRKEILIKARVILQAEKLNRRNRGWIIPFHAVTSFFSHI